MDFIIAHKELLMLFAGLGLSMIPFWYLIVFILKFSVRDLNIKYVKDLEDDD